MAGYVKCPRCDLNYISEEQEFCDVCKAELKKGPKLLFANDDEEDIDAEATELCPICKQNYIRANEEMCKACREEAGNRREDEMDLDKDESWKEYLDDDKDDELDQIPEGFAELAEEEEEEEEDSYTGEKAPVYEEPDDFDLGPVDASDFEDREEEEDLEDEDDDLD